MYTEVSTWPGLTDGCLGKKKMLHMGVLLAEDEGKGPGSVGQQPP